MQASEQGEDVKINPAAAMKPLHKIIADHKDVVKILIQLNSVMSTCKPEIAELLATFSIYSELWDEASSVMVVYAPE